MNDLEAKTRDVPKNQGIRRALYHFSPQWFTLTMGSGITSILLYNFPYSARWLYWLSVVVFAPHTLLTCLFTTFMAVRFILWPQLLVETAHQDVESNFSGAFVVSVLSLANMVASICAPAWGTWAADLAWGIWIAASVMALFVGVYIPWFHVQKYVHHHTSAQQTRKLEFSNILQPLRALSPVHLLPPISAIVASTTAATIAKALPTTGREAGTIIAGYVLHGVGLALALLLLTLYFLRLLLFGLPDRSAILTGFIAIGPLNMGAAGAVMLGETAKAVDLGGNGTGNGLHAVGLWSAMLLWGFALLWLWFALGGVLMVLRHPVDAHNDQRGNGPTKSNNATNQTQQWTFASRLPFGMSYWSIVFPLGTFALSTSQLAIALTSAFFRVLAALLCTLVALIFTILFIVTTMDLITNRGRRVLKSPAAEALNRRKARSARDERSVNGGSRGGGEMEVPEKEGDREQQQQDDREGEVDMLRGVDSADTVTAARGGRPVTGRRRRGKGDSNGSGSVRSSADDLVAK